MKHLFIIRHGEYQGVDLSPYGREQIENIAKDMKKIIGKHERHQIISSTAPRAEQTAQIIMNSFGLKSFERNSILRTDGGSNLHRSELEDIDALIKPYEECDVVTITTHYEVVGSYPSYIIRKKFGRETYIGRPERGEGIHIDFGKKTHQFVPLSR